MLVRIGLLRRLTLGVRLANSHPFLEELLGLWSHKIWIPRLLYLAMVPPPKLFRQTECLVLRAETEPVCPVDRLILSVFPGPSATAPSLPDSKTSGFM